MNFSHAPRDRIRFVAKIEKLILRILGHPEALVTDESLLSDFCLFDSDRAVRPGKRTGYFVFKLRRLKKGIQPGLSAHLDPENFEEFETETRAIPFRRSIIRKVLRHTGVDITSVYDSRIPEVFQFIAANMPENYRRRLFENRKS
jgi:hypothetical protein